MLRSKFIITLLYIVKVVAGSVLAIIMFQDDFFQNPNRIIILAIFALCIGIFNMISGFSTRKDNLNFGSLILSGVIHLVFGALIFLLKPPEIQWLIIIVTIWGCFTLFAYFRELYLFSTSMNRYIFKSLKITALIIIIIIIAMAFLPIDLINIKFKIFSAFLMWSVVFNIVVGYITVKNDYPAIRTL